MSNELRRWIGLVEGLARPEIIDHPDYPEHQVIVNPTPGMLRRLLKQDRHHEVRIITLGQDIAICSSWGIIHQDMGVALGRQAHPAWRNRHPTWYLGDGCWFLNYYPEGMMVNDKQGRIVPPDEWPLALRRAVGSDGSSS
jgi:hypothetical protein